MGRVWRKFGKDVPDNGHEHLAYSDDGFLVTTAGPDFKQVHMMDTGKERYSVIADFESKRKIVKKQLLVKVCFLALNKI